MCRNRQQSFLTYTLLLITILVNAITLQAQQDSATREDFVPQIKILDQKFFKELLKYRLPTWGFKVFSISGETSNRHSIYEIETNTLMNAPYIYDHQSNMTTIDLNLNPEYRWYVESDNSIQSLRVSSPLVINQENYDSSGRTYSADSLLQQSKSDNAQFELQFNPEISYTHFTYLSSESDFYYGINNISTAKYYNRTTNSESEFAQDETWNSQYNYENYDNQFGNSLIIGIGYGRMRNVSPVLKATRFLERAAYRLGNSTVTDSLIYNVAQQFAKQSAYSQTGFRQEKFFWNDLFEVSGLGTQFTPFDVNYLQEVNLEALGNRYEGYNIDASVVLNYNYNFDRQKSVRDDTLTQDYYRNYSHLIRYGGLLSFVYSKNFSLKMQYRTNSNVSYQFGKWSGNEDYNGKDTGNWFNFYHSQQFLYLFSDKFYVVSDFGVFGSSIKRNLEYETFHSMNTLFFQNGFSYFLERSTLITAHLSYYKLFDGQDESSNDSSNFQRNSDRNDQQYFLRVSIKHFFGGSVW